MYLQLAPRILFTKEGRTILVLIDDWTRTHNCHERACHPKRVSFTAQQQPVLFFLLLLVASLTSWRTITFWRSHPSREEICSSMREVQIAWCSPAPSGTWSGSPGFSSTTSNAEDPFGTSTSRECDCPLRCGGERVNLNSLAAQQRQVGFCRANNEESCSQISEKTSEPRLYSFCGFLSFISNRYILIIFRINILIWVWLFILTFPIALLGPILILEYKILPGFPWAFEAYYASA